MRLAWDRRPQSLPPRQRRTRGSPRCDLRAIRTVVATLITATLIEDDRAAPRSAEPDVSGARAEPRRRRGMLPTRPRVDSHREPAQRPISYDTQENNTTAGGATPSHRGGTLSRSGHKLRGDGCRLSHRQAASNPLGESSITIDSAFGTWRRNDGEFVDLEVGLLGRDDIRRRG
jgi:hypothetical protein